MKKNIMLMFLSCLLIACNDYRRQMAEQIIELEGEVMKDFQKEKVTRLVGSYDRFIQKFPKDSTNKGFMMKAAEISMLNEDAETALKFLNMFLAQYPHDSRAGTAQFKKAIVYDVLVHDPLKAGTEYEKFIQQYPDHPSREEATNALLLIRDPEAFTKMLMQADSLVADTI